MKKRTFKAELRESEWVGCRTADEFTEMYPPHIEGRYMPQPWMKPEKYPCMIKEICIINNPNGSDHQILDFVYDFELVD